MFKIQLTRGSGWNPAVVEVHSVEKAIHIAEVDRLADQLFSAARRKPRGPDGYRILDALGKVIKVGP